MLLRDGVTHHPKLLTVGAEAAWLWVAAIDYARAHLTDGFVPAVALPTLVTNCRTRVEKLAAQLVSARLFVSRDGGYVVNDFLEHNDSRAQVEAKRAADAKRKAEYRAKRERRVPPMSQLDNEPVRHVSQRDTSVLARAYPGVGVGVGTDGGTSEGEREGKPALPDDVWQAWRTAAARHGTDIRLSASHTETAHCMELAGAYTVDDLTPALQAWWASAHTGGRSLGLFKSQIADVLAHLASGSRAQFRAPPPPAGATAKAAPAYRSHADWVCPHAPHCGGRRACETRQALDAAKAVGA